MPWQKTWSQASLKSVLCLFRVVQSLCEFSEDLPLRKMSECRTTPNLLTSVPVFRYDMCCVLKCEISARHIV